MPIRRGSKCRMQVKGLNSGKSLAVLSLKGQDTGKISKKLTWHDLLVARRTGIMMTLERSAGRAAAGLEGPAGPPGKAYHLPRHWQ